MPVFSFRDNPDVCDGNDFNIHSAVVKEKGRCIQQQVRYPSACLQVSEMLKL